MVVEVAYNHKCYSILWWWRKKWEFIMKMLDKNCGNCLRRQRFQLNNLKFRVFIIIPEWKHVRFFMIIYEKCQANVNDLIQIPARSSFQFLIDKNALNIRHCHFCIRWEAFPWYTQSSGIIKNGKGICLLYPFHISVVVFVISFIELNVFPSYFSILS